MNEDIELVKKLRKSLNITHDDLAILFGVHATTAYRWESGSSRLNSWQRVMMKKFLKAADKVSEDFIISQVIKSEGIPKAIYLLLFYSGDMG